MNLLLDTVFYALWFTFAVLFVRALPWPQSWRTRKPLSCNVCLLGWCIIGMALYRGGSLRSLVDGSVFVLVSAGGLAALLLAVHDYWRGSGLQPPE